MRKKILGPILIAIIVAAFFWQSLFKGMLPIPSDTIIGLYHPFRDLYAKDFPRGIPFKNFLITDPVRQQIPWKSFSVESLKDLNLPIWNPYVLAGTPHIANFQSSSFNPLNIFLFLLPFEYGWSILIISQLILAGIFMYLYLSFIKLKKEAVVLGTVSFIFSGFFIAWLEWGTIISVAMWAPLILLLLEKLFESKSRKWVIALSLSLLIAFFAGHVQTFFYLIVLALGYCAFLVWDKRDVKKITDLALSFIIFLILSLPQLLPTLKFVNLSARTFDLDWQKEGWFIPFKHLVQFIAPDFFGNPTTLNYFGAWNYAELVGYGGILTILMAVLTIFLRSKRVLFFWLVILVALIFALPNPLSYLPFSLNIPIISTFQPTRLLFLIGFALSVLAAFGFDYFLSKGTKKVIIIIGVFSALFVLLYSISTSFSVFQVASDNAAVIRRNLYFPSLIFATSAIALIVFVYIKNKKIRQTLTIILMLILIFDLFRFGWKFTPFTNSEYLFPPTEALDFLVNQKDQNFRIMSTTQMIMPPNFSMVYRLQSIEGYDPLYLLRYAELLKAAERGKSDINPPFGFNRIITLSNPNSPIVDLLNVKYVLSLNEILSPKFTQVFSEGQTKIYENRNFIPRAFLVSQIHPVGNKQDAISAIFNNFDPRSEAIVEDYSGRVTFASGSAAIRSYNPNKVIIETENKDEGFLVLLDTFYPTWEAKILDLNKKTIIYRTNYNFRGVVVPEGKHTIEFSTKLF